MKKASLVLANGLTINGTGVGSCGNFTGELVFTTAMVGYPETLTDPSYFGQIVLFTYPEQGNYGWSSTWPESDRICACGFVAARLTNSANHYLAESSLDHELTRAGIGGIIDVDTRTLVIRLREQGTVMATLSVKQDDAVASCQEYAPTPLSAQPYQSPSGQALGRPRVVLLDYGAKLSITRELERMGACVIRLPGNSTIKQILAACPDGIVLSNGPGDPLNYPIEIAVICELLAAKNSNGRSFPIFGICLGHQFLCLALGATVYKLPYGHRGINQPVIDTLTNRGYITSHNHGYSVLEDTLPRDVSVWLRHGNDGTVEGIRHLDAPWQSVQFHPEGNPGPLDTIFMLEDFVRIL